MIELRHLSFAYASQPIIQELSYRIPEHTMCAVTGPSGRGKSTLLYLVGLLLSPNTGRILVDDVDTIGLSDRQKSALRATTIGFVFQDAALDPTRTVLDNITEGSLYAGMALAEARTRARTLMEQLEVELRAEAKPGQVSGGQAQRIALCRALLNQPSIVLADEPTGNLDDDTATHVIAALRNTARSGGTVLVATHDPRVIAVCDEVLAL